MALLGGFARAPRLHLLEALEIPPSAAPRRAGYRRPRGPSAPPRPRVAAGGTPPPKTAAGAASLARGGGWAAVSPTRAVFQRQAGKNAPQRSPNRLGGSGNGHNIAACVPYGSPGVDGALWSLGADIIGPAWGRLPRGCGRSQIQVSTKFSRNRLMLSQTISVVTTNLKA